jgi:hypothetical protein
MAKRKSARATSTRQAFKPILISRRYRRPPDTKSGGFGATALFGVLHGCLRGETDVVAEIDPATFAFGLDRIHQNGTEPVNFLPKRFPLSCAARAFRQKLLERSQTSLWYDVVCHCHFSC